MWRLTFPILLGVLACCAACCAHTPQWPSSGVYRGTYLLGDERSDFTPEGTRERWWLSGDTEAITSRMGVLGNPVFVSVEGQLSQRGKFGHLGAYRRELRVTRVIEVLAAKAKTK